MWAYLKSWLAATLAEWRVIVPTGSVWAVLLALVVAWLTGAGPVAPPPQPPPPPILPPPTDPPVVPPTAARPLEATVRIRSGSAGCTATVLLERPSPSTYWMLTAAHCVRGGPGSGTAVFEHWDKSTVSWTVIRVDAASDLCLALITTDRQLPGALLADGDPGAGTPVWHQGFGVDRPGSLEKGTVVGGPDRNGQIEYRLSVSSGDSGSGVFRQDTGRWCGAVCCTSGQRMWAGGVSAARRLMITADPTDGPAPSDLAPYVECHGCHSWLHPLLRLSNCGVFPPLTSGSSSSSALGRTGSGPVQPQ